MEVHPIAITQIDGTSYLGFLKRYGMSPNYNSSIGDIPAFLSSLSNSKDYRYALRNNSNILNHISASFIVHCSIDFLTHVTNLDIFKIANEIRRDFIIIVSGSLKQWRSSIIDSCVEESTYEARFIMNSCLLYFEKARLHEVFANYSKKTLQDSTFILKEKS